MAEYSIPQMIDGAGFQVCTIFVCISCIFYTMMRSKPEKLQNRLFLAIVTNILIAAVCNFVSTLTKPFLLESDTAFMFAKGARFVYFLFHAHLAPLFCFYVANVTGAHYRLRKKWRFLYEFPMYICLVLVFMTPFKDCVYYFTDTREFTRNWGEYVIYIVSLIYFLFAVAMVLFYWKAITRRVKRVMVYYFTVVSVGTVIQLIYMMRTELFAEAIAMTGIMITIESEEGRRDPRTGIYNHAALTQDIQRNLSVRQSFHLICVKMQNPSSMMQMVGPANIEKLTTITAAYLSTLVKRHNIYYIGTGTFVIISESEDKEENLKIARMIHNRFHYSWSFQDREAVFHAAVFCAEIPTDLHGMKDIMMLINSPLPADRRMEDDIYFGKNLNFIMRRSQVERAVTEGLDNHRFEVYYQPIYRTKDNSICAGEALLRLHDPTLGDIYPEEFLGIVERNGLIFALGDYALEEVCKFLNSGIPVELGIETLNVNLSVIQCMQANYAERIMQIVSQYDISPSRISFEITESAATTDFETLRIFVETLRTKGFRFSVDDYGIGYSNVHSVFALDIDSVKIDRSILWEAERTKNGRVVMESTVDMIKRMDRKILISGVENRHQIDLAAEFGVDYLQGFYFSNPINQNEFISILKATQLAKYEEQKALAASEAMSNFLANMSHEIRTPINAVLGMDEMILRESNDDRIIEYAKTIEGAGKTLLSLINDILDFSKIEAGSIEIVEEEYQMSTLVTDVIGMIRVKTDQKGLSFHHNIDPKLPDRLYGDEARIRQILLNLLNNAVKYTKEGSVTLSVNFTQHGDRDLDLEFSVMDTGIGIREEDLSKLFDKFARLDIEKNRTIEGSGLGLAITKQLVARMHGDIKVSSTYGKGSTFTVVLPQKIIGSELVGKLRNRVVRGSEIKSAKHNGFTADKARILVVDDTPMNLIVVRELLKRTKITIDEATSGEDALKLMKDTPYDLIFLDYRMPVMDGIETLNRLQEMEDCANVDTPVICLTANAITGAKERFIKKGFDDYLTKPIDGALLEEMLIRYLPRDKVVLDKSEPAPDEHTEQEEPQSTGFDPAKGVKNCGSEEAFQNVYAAFRQEIAARSKVIRESLDSGDIDRYRVEVHAVKSSGRIIGDEALGKLAEELEAAAGASDIERMKKDTDALLTLYTAHAEKTPGADNDEQTSERKEPITKKQWADAKDTLRVLADAMDYDSAVAVLDALKKYKLTEAMEQQVASLTDMVYGLKWTEMAAYLDEQVPGKGE